MKIPKIIHYCWFGSSNLPQSAQEYLDNWKKILPEYSFMRWDESNIDIETIDYVRNAYKNRKYAFVSDYARIKSLYEYGGIYLDLDVEVCKRFDEFLSNDMFLSFEDAHHVSTAIIGSVKEHFLLKELLDYYTNAQFSTKTNVELLTQKLCLYGLKQNNKQQSICNDKIMIYPNEYFSPLKFGSNKPDITDNTVTVHWFDGTWQDNRIKIKLKIIRIIQMILGKNIYYSVIRRIKGTRFSSIRIAELCTDIDIYKNNELSYQYNCQVKKFFIDYNAGKVKVCFDEIRFCLKLISYNTDYLLCDSNISKNLIILLDLINITILPKSCNYKSTGNKNAGGSKNEKTC